MACRLAQQRMTLNVNDRFRIARYLCGSWASCIGLLAMPAMAYM